MNLCKKSIASVIGGLSTAFAVCLLSPAARANVYATDIKLNGNLTNNAVAAPGNPVAISFILNEAATAGTTINILSNNIVLRTLTIASGTQGTLRGLNTVTWDGRDGATNPVALGTYSVSITTAANGFGNWTQTSSDSVNYVWSCEGVAVNVNSNSPYYGRVFIANAQAGSPLTVVGNVDGISKWNSDGSFADEGQSTGGYNFYDDGGSDLPVRLKFGSDDRIYFNDWTGDGKIVSEDSAMTSYKVVLNTTSHNNLDFDILDMETSHGLVFFCDYSTGAGVFAWKAVNGVATGSSTQMILLNSGAVNSSARGISVDENTNVYVTQELGGTDAHNRAFLFPTWNGSSSFTTNYAWAVGGGDSGTQYIVDCAVDNRKNPKYLALALDASASSPGVRILNPTNGATITSSVSTGVYDCVCFDNVGNLYLGTPGSSSSKPNNFGYSSLHVWRVFSPPGANTNTTISYPTVVMTNLPPSITTQPTNPGTLNQGTSLTLYVVAAGTLPLSYQWYFNTNTPLPGQTASNLVFNTLQTSNSGTYFVVVSNAYGSVTSSVASLTVAAAPQVVQAPQSRFAYVNGAASFNVSAIGSQPLSYQWQFGSTNIPGATNSSLTLANLQTSNSGAYRCVVTNAFGSTNSPAATLTVLQPVQSGGYVETILADSPLAFWRLDESSGNIAHDSVGAFDGTYSNVVLGVTGYSTIDPDTAVLFGPGPNSYVANIQSLDFEQTNNVSGFSLEAWVNGSSSQTSGAGIIAKGNGGGGEQFDLDVSGGKYRFFVRDSKGAIPPGGTVTASVGPNGTWQHVVAVYDGAGSGVLYLYVNGQFSGSQVASTNGVLSSTHPVSIGSRQSGSGAYDFNFAGTIDEVAIYGTALNSSQVYNHYNALLNWPGFPPLVAQQPQSVTVYPGASPTFTVTAGGDLSSMTYQWILNGTNVITGANSSSYTIAGAQLTDAGLYSCLLSNNYGYSNSLAAQLTVLVTNGYESTILNDQPIAYWRLDETNGTIAHDYLGGNNGVYNNVALGLPGYSLVDLDTCVGLGGTNNSYVYISNTAPFNFTSYNSGFTLEAWVNFTNLTGVQRIFSCLSLNSPHGYGFGINGPNGLRFTQAGVQDADLTLANALVAGVWYHLAVTCDGVNYYYYVNGNPVGLVGVSGAGSGIGGAHLQLGANGSTWISTAPEQVYGRLDEAAVYNYALSSAQLLAHFNSRPTPQLPLPTTPIASPATNYVSLTTTILENAAGQMLSYQWYKSPSTLLAGATDSTLTLSPLDASSAGSYYVQVSNPGGTTNSPAVAITVLPIPTNAAQLNLTNALVLHLPFDGNYNDASGRSNNGTNVGATTFVSPGAIGASALHYSSDATAGSYNYVTLGVRPDLQFGSSVNFSVSYWIRQPNGSSYTNLPFFTDAIGSTVHGGFAFAPYQTISSSGGWMWTVGTVTSPNQYTTFSDANVINDGNWHHLVHVANRSATLTTYLDGVQVDSQAINIAGNINTPNAATIGQDPTGTYAVTADADIDDLGMWQRTLTPLEVSGIYLAGFNNGVSFATVPTPPPVLSFQILSNGQLHLTWTSGTLVSSTNAAGPYTPVIGATSPYNVNTSSGQQMYFGLAH